MINRVCTDARSLHADRWLGQEAEMQRNDVSVSVLQCHRIQLLQRHFRRL